MIRMESNTAVGDPETIPESGLEDINLTISSKPTHGPWRGFAFGRRRLFETGYFRVAVVIRARPFLATASSRLP